MSNTYDCIVLGAGGFGSGALYHLARRNVRVLGIDRFGMAHDRGSSHGETRIIRKAYFEHPDYVPLLLRAYELWRQLEQQQQVSLCRLCGLMLAGPPQGDAIRGARLAARLHDLDIEDVDPSEAGPRFAGFRFPESYRVVFEADAGYLRPEVCVRAHLEQAQARGAVLNFNEAVVDWKADHHTVRLRTEQGVYETAQLVVTAGPWASQMLAGLTADLRVVRKPVFWHEVTSPVYEVAAGCPAFYFELPAGDYYGFPSLDGRTVKLAEHSGGGHVADPLALDRDVHREDIEPVQKFIEQIMPHVRPDPVRYSVCMYTQSPDHHFIVDRHPEHKNVVIGAGFSGHGFKFTSVLGEALTDLALDGQTSLPVEFLSLNRLSERKSS